MLVCSSIYMCMHVVLARKRANLAMTMGHVAETTTAPQPEA